MSAAISIADFSNLRALSARMGADPLLVQAAGGNTSLKHGGVMWIKASGTWLCHALAKDIFVPVDHAKLMEGLQQDDPACETCAEFVRADLNNSGLRPSIETTVHALMPQTVVLHVHCVNTIAWAIMQNAERLLQDKLRTFQWAFIPYARPGMSLAREISARLKPGTNVLVLGNHGLVVAADSVRDAELLLEQVVSTLKRHTRPLVPADKTSLLQACAGTDFIPAEAAETHALATDASALDRSRDCVLYPDHVVFLGVGVNTNIAAQASFAALPGLGVVIGKSANPAVEPMLRCLADIMRRVDTQEDVTPLPSLEIDRLINWEAEKYRQSINVKP